MKRWISIILVTLLFFLNSGVSAESIDIGETFRNKFEEFTIATANSGQNASQDESAKDAAYIKTMFHTFEIENTFCGIELGLLPYNGMVMRPWHALILTQDAEYRQSSFEKALMTQFLALTGYLYLPLFNTELIPQSEYKITFESTDYFKSDTFDFMFVALKENSGKYIEFINDELYVVGRYQATDEQAAASGLQVWNLVAITDQQIVTNIVKSLYFNENTKAGLSNDLVEWLSRRPDSGFLVSIILPDKDDTTAESVATDESDIAEALDTPARYVRIQDKSDVNVRQKPDTESKRLGRAKAGKEYKWLSTASNGWYEIQLDENITGYVSNKVTKLIEK